MRLSTVILPLALSSFSPLSPVLPRRRIAGLYCDFPAQICLRPRLLRLLAGDIVILPAMECTERMLPSWRVISPALSLQFVVPASREHLLDVTTPYADVWRHDQVQLLLFSQRLQH